MSGLCAGHPRLVLSGTETWMAGTSPATTESLGQRPRQQAFDIVIGEIDRAVHAGVRRGKSRGSKQLGMMWRDLVERRRGSKQRQLFDRQPRHPLAIRPAK